MTTPLEFDRVAACARNSALFRAMDSVATAVERAAKMSEAAARVRRARARFAALPSAERLQTIAVLVATAAIGHMALLALVPAHIAPATPATLWIAVAAMSAIVALFARRLAASWETSAVSSFLPSAGFSGPPTRP